MKVIGVLGGMGPEATNDLCAMITRFTPAQSDQEHLQVLSFNNPRIPDRTAAILRGGESPLEEICHTGLTLEKAGADFLVIPCNTAHHYYPQLTERLRIPVVHMIQETAAKARQLLPDAKVAGLLSTSGTLGAGIYQQPFTDAGFSLVSPNETDQQALVMDSIYAIKAGEKEQAAQNLAKAAQKLIDEGAELIIAGCTEIPLALTQDLVPVPMINPAEILARAAVRVAMESP